MKTTAKELRLHVKRVLDALERGEEVTITHRGKPRAKIVPVRSEKRRKRRKAKELPLFGIWRDHAGTRDVGAYVDRVRRGRH